MAQLGPEAAHIFRVTHADNISWILQHGLHCKTSELDDPNFVPIGSLELIHKRTNRRVPIAPGGVLGDYVPFYITPWSVMMLNIKTGRNGVIKRANRDIAILVSSLHKIDEMGLRYVFTNGHAYMQESDFFDGLSDLDKIDWGLLRKRDFKNDPEDPGKLGRYQAEALVHGQVPVEALAGIACYDIRTQGSIKNQMEKLGLVIPVKVISDWYF